MKQITLKEARSRVGLSQRKVAETLGVTDQTICNWERNTAAPDINKARKLAELYQVRLDDLIFLPSKSN